MKSFNKTPEQRLELLESFIKTLCNHKLDDARHDLEQAKKDLEDAKVDCSRYPDDCSCCFKDIFKDIAEIESNIDLYENGCAPENLQSSESKVPHFNNRWPKKSK